MRWSRVAVPLVARLPRVPSGYLVLAGMTFIVATLLGVLAMLAAAIAGLLVQRRALREGVDQFRLRADQAPVLIWTVRPDTTLDYLNGTVTHCTDGNKVGEGIVDATFTNVLSGDDGSDAARTPAPRSLPITGRTATRSRPGQGRAARDRRGR